jgi:hypothetical protein
LAMVICTQVLAAEQLTWIYGE